MGWGGQIRVGRTRKGESHGAAALHVHVDGQGPVLAAALAPAVEEEARECQGWERSRDGGGARAVVLQPGAETRVDK